MNPFSERDIFFRTLTERRQTRKDQLIFQFSCNKFSYILMLYTQNFHSSSPPQMYVRVYTTHINFSSINSAKTYFIGFYQKSTYFQHKFNYFVVTLVFTKEFTQIFTLFLH